MPPTQRDESKRLQCRFYEELYPNPESMVMVKVMNIADMAAEVILLEYNDIEVRGCCGGGGGRVAGGKSCFLLCCSCWWFTWSISIHTHTKPHRA